MTLKYVSFSYILHEQQKSPKTNKEIKETKVRDERSVAVLGGWSAGRKISRPIKSS